MFENLVVKIRSVSDATQTQILNINCTALYSPSSVTQINKPFNSAIKSGTPGVIKGRGDTITAANSGMKIVVLKKKNLSGILEIKENSVNAGSNTINEIMVLENTAVKIKSRKEHNLILASILCKAPLTAENLSTNIMS